MSGDLLDDLDGWETYSGEGLEGLDVAIEKAVREHYPGNPATILEGDPK